MLSDLAKRAIAVKCALESSRYKAFVEALESLKPFAAQALFEQGALPFVLALANLPAAFDQLVKHAKNAEEMRQRVAMTYARPAKMGRPRITENRKLHLDHLRRLAQFHSPYLAEGPKALEKWLMLAAPACGVSLTKTPWRQQALIRKKSLSPLPKK
jgi:hypothetical protein